jgi:hypothetical protein
MIEPQLEWISGMVEYIKYDMLLNPSPGNDRETQALHEMIALHDELFIYKKLINEHMSLVQEV